MVGCADVTAVWQFGFNQPSPIDAVLDKEVRANRCHPLVHVAAASPVLVQFTAAVRLCHPQGVTLDEILAEEELIQECKAINPKLVDL